MYGSATLTAAFLPELAGRPLAWAVTAAVITAVVAALAAIRGFTKAAQGRSGR